MTDLRPVLLTITLLLTGCAGSGKPADSASQSSWWNPVSWSWSRLAPWHWFGSSLQLTEQGIGGITGSTPMQEKAIDAGLNGRYVLRNGVRMVDQNVTSFCQALDDHKQVKIEFSGTETVSRIDVMDPTITTENGVKVGMRFSELYRRAFDVCKKGSGLDRHSIECRAPNSQHIRYAFSGDWHGPATLIPADDILQNWTLSKIVWQR